MIEQHGDDILKKVTLQRFMDGDEELYARGLNINIQIACDSRGEPLAKNYIAKNAEELYREYSRRTKEYSIVFSNCHQFCWECIKPESDKRLTLFTTLEEYLAKEYECMLYWDKVEM